MSFREKGSRGSEWEKLDLEARLKQARVAKDQRRRRLDRVQMEREQLRIAMDSWGLPHDLLTFIAESMNHAVSSNPQNADPIIGESTSRQRIQPPKRRKLRNADSGEYN